MGYGSVLPALKRSFLIIIFAFSILLLLPSIAHADDDVNYVVDSSGGGDFTTIQAAVNVVQSATPGSATNYTITVKEGATGIYTETVAILQQANKNLTIEVAEGESVTLKGQFKIDGMNRNAGLETLAIEGFAITVTSGDCITTYNSGGATHYCYMHNVTIKNCVFAGGTSSAGLRVTAGTSGEAMNISMENCSTTPGMHSLMQGAGGSQNVSFIGCILDGTRGVNLLVSGSLIITDCDFKAEKYAVRLGQGENPKNDLTTCKVEITNSVLYAANVTAYDEGVFVTRWNAPTDIEISQTEFANISDPDGVIWNNVNAVVGRDYMAKFSDNYWGPEGLTASRFSGIPQDKTQDIIVLSGDYYINDITYDANGGMFSSSNTETVTKTEKVKVTFNGPDQVNYLAPVVPLDAIRSGYVLVGWYTDIVGGEKVSAEPENPLSGNYLITHDGDGPMYAHWVKKPIVTVVTNPLQITSDQTLTQQEFLVAIGAQATGSQGNSLPQSNITISNWSNIQFGVVNDPGGTPYTVELSVVDNGVPSDPVSVDVNITQAAQKPTISVQTNPLQIASDQTLTQQEFLSAIGASALDSQGNPLPSSAITIANWSNIKFGVVNYPNGTPYEVQLTVTDGGLTSDPVSVGVLVTQGSTGPSIVMTIQTLYLTSSVTLTQEQYLAAIGAEAFDEQGNALPISKISITNWNDLEFGKANYGSGVPYTLVLSIAYEGLTLAQNTSVTQNAYVYVMDATVSLSVLADYKAMGLPDPPEGFTWMTTPDGYFVLGAKDSPTPQPVPGGNEPNTPQPVPVATPAKTLAGTGDDSRAGLGIALIAVFALCGVGASLKRMKSRR